MTQMRGHGPALTGLTRLQKDSEGNREGCVVAQEHRGQPSQSSALRVTEVSERPDKVGWVRRPPGGAGGCRGMEGRDGQQAPCLFFLLAEYLVPGSSVPGPGGYCD